MMTQIDNHLEDIIGAHLIGKPILYENVVLGSLKIFFQLNHEVDCSLYLMKATAFYHSK